MADDSSKTGEIVIRFVAHRGIFDTLCRIAQYGEWPTHCEAVLKDGRRLGSWFTEGGVKILPPDYDGGRFNRELFFKIKCTPAQEARFHQFLHDQIGKPYDVGSIVFFYSVNRNRNWQATYSWFCDELIAGGMVACGLLPEHMAVNFNRLSVRDVMILLSPIAETG